MFFFHTCQSFHVFLYLPLISSHFFFFFSLYHFSVDTFNVPSWLFEVEMQEDAGPGSSTFLSILAEMSFPGLGTVLAHV